MSRVFFCARCYDTEARVTKVSVFADDDTTVCPECGKRADLTWGYSPEDLLEIMQGELENAKEEYLMVTNDINACILEVHKILKD